MNSLLQGVTQGFSLAGLMDTATAIYAGPQYMSGRDWERLYSACDKWGADYKADGIERAMAKIIALECNCDGYFAFHGSNRGALETGLAVLQSRM